MSANAVAAYGGEYDPYAEYGKEASRTKLLLKFSKGFWTVGQDNTDVKVGTRVLANMPELRIGWIKWANNRPVDEKMAVLESRQPRYQRGALGDADRALWDLDEASGQPRDPWQETSTLPVLTVGTDEDWLFSTSSAGGRGAVAQLCIDYGKTRRQHAGQTPVIELGADSYQHPNKNFGRIHVPTLKIVDWVDNPGGGTEEAGLLTHATGTVEEVAQSTAGGKAKPLF